MSRLPGPPGVQWKELLPHVVSSQQKERIDLLILGSNLRCFAPHIPRRYARGESKACECLACFAGKLIMPPDNAIHSQCKQT
eukprot:4926774-Amphidinium_carterae.1